jgi:hypothetical protein
MGENNEICLPESGGGGAEDKDCIHLNQTTVKYEPSNKPSFDLYKKAWNFLTRWATIKGTDCSMELISF